MLAGSRTVGAALLALVMAILVGAASSHAAVEATCMGEPATIVGTENSDTLNGTEGEDVIAGLGGDDTISAGGGSDFVLADPGNDRIDGGGSSGDTIDFAASPRRVSVNLGSGKASGFGADVVTGFEHVAGTKYADVLTGNAAANRLQGGAGNDRLLGGGGRDTLTGQQGRDFADGGPARDICSAELKKRCP